MEKENSIKRTVVLVEYLAGAEDETIIVRQPADGAPVLVTKSFDELATFLREQ